MTGKPRKPGDDQPTETAQPGQQIQDDGGSEGGENFGNIEPDPGGFGNIDPNEQGGG